MEKFAVLPVGYFCGLYIERIEMNFVDGLLITAVLGISILLMISHLKLSPGYQDEFKEVGVRVLPVYGDCLK